MTTEQKLQARPANYIPVDCDKLRNLYVDQRKTAKDCSAIMDLPLGTVYSRLRSMGITRTQSEWQKGKRPSNWKGSTIAAGGYIYVRIEPQDPMSGMATKEGYVMEHRLVVARQIGRPLSPREVVHHKDSNRQNNDPLNLELLPSQSEHMKIHMTPERAIEMNLLSPFAKAA